MAVEASPVRRSSLTLTLIKSVDCPSALVVQTCCPPAIKVQCCHWWICINFIHIIIPPCYFVVHQNTLKQPESHILMPPDATNSASNQWQPSTQSFLPHFKTTSRHWSMAMYILTGGTLYEHIVWHIMTYYEHKWITIMYAILVQYMFVNLLRHIIK